jgi:hypothetical protein
MSTFSGPPGSATGPEPDDEYIDVPLWGDLEQEHGICDRCGNLTDDPTEHLCDACWELAKS